MATHTATGVCLLVRGHRRYDINEDEAGADAARSALLPAEVSDVHDLNQFDGVNRQSIAHFPRARTVQRCSVGLAGPVSTVSPACNGRPFLTADQPVLTVVTNFERITGSAHRRPVLISERADHSTMLMARSTQEHRRSTVPPGEMPCDPVVPDASRTE